MNLNLETINSVSVMSICIGFTFAAMLTGLAAPHLRGRPVLTTAPWGLAIMAKLAMAIALPFALFSANDHLNDQTMVSTMHVLGVAVALVVLGFSIRNYARYAKNRFEALEAS